jgi:glycosyltransferase involved in cell wall biosynthesis
MNLCLINHYAGSPQHGMEYRPYYLAREWVRAGHVVHIHAASFSHVRREQVSAVETPFHQVMEGIDYHWWPTPAYQGNGVGRVLNIWAFLRRLWQHTARLVKNFKPDVVIASSTYPLDIWVARRMARLSGAKLVYEVHDLWPASPIELSNMSPYHPFIMLCQKAENDAYRDADAVVSMLPNVAQHMRSHGLNLARLHIVPNGVSPDDWAAHHAPLCSAIMESIQAHQRAGRQIVVYAGSHGAPNALDILLDAAQILRHEPIAFVLVGDGQERAGLVSRRAQLGLSKVAFFNPIAKAQIPALLAQADVAYLGWKPLPIYRFGIAPNKLMDYMMAGCAVLHSVQAGNDPVQEAQCGLTVAPNDPIAVAQGLRQLLALSSQERHSMGEKGRAHVLKHHTYPVLAARFIQAIE